MIQIDTGHTEPHAADYVPDWFKDQHPNSDSDRLAHDFAYHMIGEMLDPNGPMKMATIRSHTTAKWPFLLHLSKIHPEVFDEVLTSYSERLMRD